MLFVTSKSKAILKALVKMYTFEWFGAEHETLGAIELVLHKNVLCNWLRFGKRNVRRF